MRTDYVKPRVYLKIYPLMQYENALALRLSLETGLRIGDVLALETQHFKGRTIRYTAAKTGKSGKKVISADLAKRLHQIEGDHWLFVGRFGDKPRTRAAVYKDLKKAVATLGIKENVSCHSARKTYAVELNHERGFGAVQKELQHSRADTTMLYAFADLLSEKNSPERREDIVEIVEMIRDIHRVLVGARGASAQNNEL